MSENAIRQVFTAYQAAVRAKDVDTFAALYDPEVRIFDLWGRWSSQGLEATRKMATEWFGSLGSEYVVVDVAEIQIAATPGLAVAHAFLTYTGMSAEGQKLRSMSNRLTWALKPVDAGWKIVHEHTSVPVDPTTIKAILKRA